MQKKGDFNELKKLIHKHKTENWYVFLKYLQELRIKNCKRILFKIKILYLYK